MILKHHSRKQRQLKSSIKKISILLKKTDSDTDSEINKIIKKIKFLVNQLNGIISNNRMKRILGTISLVIGISFANTANAQWFAYPIQDPFNLQDPSDEEIINPEFADMDNDGDLDYLSGEYMYGLGFHYQENIGTNINPDFANPVVNPFGLIAYTPTAPNFGVWQFHNLIDLDNDGDFDILSNVVKMNYLSYAMNSDFVYYENIGTAGNPQFSAPSVNPFGLTVNNNINYTTFGDIDSDGDADILGFEFDYNSYTANFRFIENIGTASLPSFAAPQLNVFGIPAGVFAYIKLEDLDSDGDLDIIFTQEDYYSTSFGYLENTGSALVPQYNPPPVMNLFGLSFSNWQGGGIPNFKDFDGDGDNDLIVGTDDDFISYFENVGVQQTVTYECINYSCVDPGTGTGTYTTISACQSSCTPPVSFECDFPGYCYDPGDGSGLYTSYNDCMTNCTAQPSWDCVSPGNCQDFGSGLGNYFSLQDCQNDCPATPTWDCDAILGCVDPGTGTGLYASLSGCQANCSTTSLVNTEINVLKLFPNPANKVLNIISQKKINTIEIYDALGRLVIFEDNPSNIINIEQLESGIYSIAILFMDDIILKKFSKY